MSIRALAWALSTPTGSPTRKAVLLALADRYNEDEAAAWPSVGWIANVTELHPRTVRRALVELVDAGLLELVGWSNYRPDKRTKRYRLAIHRTPSTGGRSVTPTGPRGGAVSTRGGAVSSAGWHTATQTVTQPITTAPADTVRGITADDVRALRESIA